MNKANKAGRQKRSLEAQVGRHVTLSAGSLKKVWDWAEANNGNPLADAYIDACSAVGALDCRAIADVLKTTWRAKGFGYIHEAYKPYNAAFFYRDTVGRLILEMLRRMAPDDKAAGA